MIKEIAGLTQAQVITDNRGQILHGVAGVGKQKAVYFITLALKDEFQTQFDHRADMRL